MEAKDEILAEEIHKVVDKLNELVIEAIHKRGLKVDINYFPLQIRSLYEPYSLIDCKIYKEVL